jgi:catechol 2,3-dioxygenase-like lactoylglutathione lyase family enzyme
MTEKQEKIFPYLKNGLGQVAILVPDLDTAVEAYYKHYGIAPWHFYTYEQPLVKKMSYHGQPANYRMRIALSYFGPMRIELIQPLEGESVYADFIREHGYGIHHFGLIVDDMQQALQEAKDCGIEMTMDGSGYGLDGDGHYAYLDTEKEIYATLELIERPRGRLTPEKVYPAPEA